MAEGRPITTLEEVPIDAMYMKCITAILNEHGASLTVTGDYTYHEGREGYYECTITFPEGTRRVNDLTLWRSTPFKLYFPDGSILHAIQPGEGGVILRFRCEEVR